MFVLVRHAVAVNKQKWSSADRLRPLTGTGLRQSQGLVVQLVELGVTRLLCSPTERCRMTLVPTSDELSLPIASSNALGVEAPVSDLLVLLGSAASDGAALCTHGETFAALSRAWAADWPGESERPDLTATPKGGSWLIERYGTAAASARRLAMPATDQAPLRLVG